MKSFGNTLVLFLLAGLASSAESVQIPSLSCAHGVILTGIELPSDGVGEVTLQLNEVTKLGAVKGATDKFSARVLCDAKVIGSTGNINLVAKKIVYLFPSGYITEMPIAGYVVSTQDGSSALPGTKNSNLDLESQMALAVNNNTAYIKDIQPTVVVQAGRMIDLIITEQLVIEDKSKTN